MDDKRAWLIGALVVIAMLGTVLVAAGEEKPVSSLFRLAELEDLSCDLAALSESSASVGQLFVVAIPGGDLAVILRPITEAEYGTFQVQAIDYEIIERQMLAAAIVLPRAAEQDVAGFSLELVGFLRQQVNAISGFEVFDVINLSVSP